MVGLGLGYHSDVPTVLHVLSQRPSLTGSGITLDAIVRHAARAGWEQHVVVGIPAQDDRPAVGGLADRRIHPLRFDTDDLPFPVPGMSDVMPYSSTRFSALDPAGIAAYVEAWRRHLTKIVTLVGPDLIHSHHVWLMSSLLKDVAPEVPVVTQCHATGLRQMELCPHLADRVRSGCRRNDRFGVLHSVHAHQLAAVLGVAPDRIRFTGAGYRSDLFHAGERGESDRPRLLFVGKFSRAKGLPSLLDACAMLRADGLPIELHVAGTGSGPQADALRSRMTAMSPSVTMHGQLAQPELAGLMRQSDVCVLPSFFEGLPLVLVEAFACGCRLVATALPGIVENLAPSLGDGIELVAPPAMEGVDTPVAAELPDFTRRLAEAIARAVDAGPVGDPATDRPDDLRQFTWEAVFRRVETIWRELLSAPPGPR
jgi:glycosyltransferase involved in cell wall biosynthesis